MEKQILSYIFIIADGVDARGLSLSLSLLSLDAVWLVITLKKMLVIAVWLELDTLIVATKEIWKSRKRWSRSQSSKTSNNMPLKRQQMMKRWYEMEWSTIIGQEMSASIGLASLSLLSLSYGNKCVYRCSNNHSLRMWMCVPVHNFPFAPSRYLTSHVLTHWQSTAPAAWNCKWSATWQGHIS